MAAVLYLASQIPSFMGLSLPTWLTLCLNTVLLAIYCLPLGMKFIKSRRRI